MQYTTRVHKTGRIMTTSHINQGTTEKRKLSLVAVAAIISCVLCIIALSQYIMITAGGTPIYSWESVNTESAYLDIIHLSLFMTGLTAMLEMYRRGKRMMLFLSGVVTFIALVLIIARMSMEGM